MLPAATVPKHLLEGARAAVTPVVGDTDRPDWWHDHEAESKHRPGDWQVNYVLASHTLVTLR